MDAANSNMIKFEKKTNFLQAVVEMSDYNFERRYNSTACTQKIQEGEMQEEKKVNKKEENQKENNMIEEKKPFKPSKGARNRANIAARKELQNQKWKQEAEARKRSYAEIVADEKEWTEAVQQEKRLKKEAGPPVKCERQLRSHDAPMKPWVNHPMRRSPPKPIDQPQKQDIVVAETTYAVAKAMTSSAVVKVELNQLPDVEREELVDEDDDDFFYYRQLKYVDRECSESKMVHETQQPLKPIPYRSIWKWDEQLSKEQKKKLQENRETIFSNGNGESFFYPNNDFSKAPLFTFYKKKFYKRGFVKSYLNDVDAWLERGIKVYWTTTEIARYNEVKRERELFKHHPQRIYFL